MAVHLYTNESTLFHGVISNCLQISVFLGAEKFQYLKRIVVDTFALSGIINLCMSLLDLSQITSREITLFNHILRLDLFTDGAAEIDNLLLCVTKKVEIFDVSLISLIDTINEW